MRGEFARPRQLKRRIVAVTRDGISSGGKTEKEERRKIEMAKERAKLLRWFREDRARIDPACE